MGLSRRTALGTDARHIGSGSGAAWLAGTVTRCDTRSLVQQRRASPDEACAGVGVLPGVRAAGSAAQDVDADATSGEENGTSGLVVLIGRTAPVLLLALVKVLRTVNAHWVIAALPQ